MPNQTATPAIAGILRPRNTDLVDETEAAEILDVVPGTLQVWRSTGRYNIPFIKIGRKVRYSRTALNAWIESRTRSTGATA
jgi:excisionase family DNA binding protein